MYPINYVPNLWSYAHAESTNPLEGITPILTSMMNDRGQVDLIDMLGQQYNGYKWILHYQDHLTGEVLTTIILYTLIRNQQ
jgi:hypothetical protein